MAVVISEFEVVDTPPAAQRSPGADAVPPSEPALPDAADLRRLLAECAEQQLRRFSH